MSARDRQIGGLHYKPGSKIQPIDLVLSRSLGMCEGNIIKYLCRWRECAGVVDLLKAKHYLELLIEHEEKNAIAVEDGAGERFDGYQREKY